MSPTVHVIGAGPAGLAAAAVLRTKGVDVTVLEKSEHVGNAWRSHYDRLHLHTTRGLSQLPGLPIPREFGRWVSRDDVVRYLESYAAHHRLRIEHGVEVTRLDRADGAWVLTTTGNGTVSSRTADAVVVATGYNHTPHVPDWPGRDGFAGTVVHASRYRDATPYEGQDVLVAGVGNTGAEIAQDLAENGAASVRLAIRTPPHIVPRNQGPWAAQYTGLLIRHLPTALVDALSVHPRRRAGRHRVPPRAGAGARPPGRPGGQRQADRHPRPPGRPGPLLHGLHEPDQRHVPGDGGRRPAHRAERGAGALSDERDTTYRFGRDA
jgi:cation diffusion facilitator CzcD-associated flavoprotein CzcO